jgi:serine-type D-Ala-D-Ala carboxypeptidase/endopeptidase (penicillin-binding protein 4)
VSELAELALRSSDNVLAEVLAREVAIAREAEPSFAGAAQSTLAALRQAGIDTSGAEMVDGSGLSTRDQVPARLLGEILAAAASPAKGPLDTQFLRPILTGLPVAGGVGTLDGRYALDGRAAAGRGVVRAKTGSLTGVSSLAGVVTDTDGRLLVFALMSNGASPTVVRPLHDAMAAELSRCGCRA